MTKCAALALCFLGCASGSIAGEGTAWVERVHFLPTGIEQNDMRFGRLWWNLLAVNGDYVWFYLPSWREDVQEWEDDTLRIIRYHLPTGNRDTVIGVAAGLSRYLPHPAPDHFAVRDSVVLLAFTVPQARSAYTYVIRAFASGKHLSEVEWQRVQLPYRFYEYVGLLTGMKAAFGTCYRHNPSGDSGNVALTVLDLRSFQVVAHREIRGLRGIELTHFAPARFIDARGNYIALVEPGTYTVFVYDTALRERYRIVRNPADWKQIPLDTLQGLARRRGAKSLIQEGERYVYAGSRIDALVFLDEQHLLVRRVRGSGTEEAEHFRWHYDIWHLGPDSAKLVASDLKERELEASEVGTALHPHFRWTIPAADFPWIVAIQRGAPIDWVGKTSAQYRAEEEEYHKDHEPQYVLEVYRLRLPLR